MTKDGLQGHINSNMDLLISCTVGGASGGVGYGVSRFVAYNRVTNLDSMSRQQQKIYLRDKVFKSTQKSVNSNRSAYNSISTKAKVNLLMSRQSAFKSGIYSSITSTSASTIYSSIRNRRLYV